jgi:ribosome maturation factor RimP
MGFAAHFLFVGCVCVCVFVRVREAWEFVQLNELNDLIEQTVSGLGYELVIVETSPRARLLRVFIDFPAVPGEVERHIGVDDCATVSNQLTHVFLVENVDYDRLEVSSPGLDRVLIKPADFRRFSGRQIQLKLRVPLENQRNFSGLLESLTGDEGMEKVCLRSADDKLYEFALDNVDRARLVPQF